MTNAGGERRAPRWTPGAPLLGVALCIAAIPLFGVILALTDSPQDPGGAWRAPTSSGAEWGRLLRTLGIAALIGALAATFALAPAWASRALRARWMALALCPVLLPSYAAASAWGLLRAPGSPIASWIAEDARVRGPAAAFVQAVLGLALWSWPLAGVALSAGARSLDAHALDAARLHGGRAGAARIALRSMAPSFAAGAALVTIVMLGSAVPLHVAQIETSAIGVWRRLDETAGARSAWVAALPLLVAALALGALASVALLRPLSTSAGARANPAAPARTGALTLTLAALVWGASTIIPLALYLGHLREARTIPAVAASLAPALGRSAAIAAIVGLGGMTLAAAFSCALSTRRRPGPALLAAGVWIVLALAPGVLLGAAIARAGSAPWLRVLGDTGAGVTLAHLARFGAIGALAGVLLARMEPHELRDLRRMEPRPFTSWLRAAAPLQFGAILGAGLGVAALSLQEIEATVMLAAPGSQSLAQRMLAMLHYLRVEELNAAAALVLAISLTLALGAGALTSISAARLRRLSTAGASAVAMLLLVACGRPAEEGGADLDPIAVFGEVGGQPGQFVYPRCIDADESTLWFIDKRGQVQRLGEDGEPIVSWMMPDVSMGFPVGITVDPEHDGRVFIADTHCHRVMVYEADGAGGANLLRQWGSYGQEPGQFIYLTDVAIVPMPDGSRRFYVAEYGGNDRVSCFDEDANFLFAFGEGEGSSAAPERIEFARPQSVLWHPGLERLIIADAGNHRLGLFTVDGALDRWIGRVEPSLGPMPGDGEGEFNYPYGLALMKDGTILVSEFGASRVQRIDPATGARLGVWGRPGRGPGELACPWGVAAIGDIAYVLDSMNHRVAAFRPTPARGSAQRP